MSYTVHKLSLSQPGPNNENNSKTPNYTADLHDSAISMAYAGLALSESRARLIGLMTGGVGTVWSLAFRDWTSAETSSGSVIKKKKKKKNLKKTTQNPSSGFNCMRISLSQI